MALVDLQLAVVSLRLDSDVEAPLRARFERASARFERRLRLSGQRGSLSFGRWVRRELGLALQAVERDPWIGGHAQRVLGSLLEPSTTEIMKVVLSIYANPTWSGWVKMPSHQRYRKLQSKAMKSSIKCQTTTKEPIHDQQ